MKRIGYYNHNDYPVSWTTAQGQMTHELEAGQPVTNAKGFLVQPGAFELDAHVRDGLLAYATDEMPNFEEWDAVRTRQLANSPIKYRVAPLDQNGEKTLAGPRRADQIEEKRTTVATVSSADGIKEQQISANADMPSPALMEGVDVMEDGSFRFQGVVFDSIAGLKAYQELSSATS